METLARGLFPSVRDHMTHHLRTPGVSRTNRHTSCAVRALGGTEKGRGGTSDARRGPNGTQDAGHPQAFRRRRPSDTGTQPIRRPRVTEGPQRRTRRGSGEPVDPEDPAAPQALQNEKSQPVSFRNRQQHRRAHILYELQGVHILAVPPDAPVHAVRRRTVSRGCNGADHLTPCHGLAALHGGINGFKGRLQPIPVIHRDHRPVNHHTGERDCAGSGGADFRSRRGPQIHAAVPREPLLRRWLERTSDRGFGFDRPGPATDSGRRL